MKLQLFLTVAVITSLSGPLVAEAQTCIGLPGPESGTVQLAGGFASTKGVSQFTVSAGGVGANVFGGASLGSVSYDDLNGTTLLVGAGAGYRLPLGTGGTTELCPVVGGRLGIGPNDIEGSGVDASTRGASVGVSLGHRIAAGNDVAVIPNVVAGFTYSSVRFTDGVDDLENSESSAVFGVGVGFVLGKQFTAQPSVSIPIGRENSDPVFGISFTLSLGSKRP